MTAEQDITLYAKRDNTLDITIQTNAGNPVDLTNYKIVMTVKAQMADADSAALYQGPPGYANAPFGRISFLVPLATTTGAAWASATTGFYDVTAVTPSNYTVSLLAGAVTFVQPVTQSVPAGTAPLESPGEPA